MSSIPSAEEIFREALRFNSDLDLPKEIHHKVKKKLLEPVIIEDKEYSNFMEEVSRRVSQAFQPVSGYLAVLCAERELERVGLVKDLHFTKRKERTDFIVYHPDVNSYKSRHRVEVKNVSLRERGVRGLAFDGDSLFGFFNQPREFTESNVNVLDRQCASTGGFCYIPPDTLTQIPHVTIRFRPNTQFGKDMASFTKTGVIP